MRAPFPVLSPPSIKDWNSNHRNYESFARLSQINEDLMIYKLASKQTSHLESAIIDLEIN